MKVLIVFMALLVINVSFMVYQSDMGRYERIQNFLKATAEECAAGAALYYDETYYGTGKLVFNYKSGEDYVVYLLQNLGGNAQIQGDRIVYELAYEDDLLGYTREAVPSVTVSLKVGVKDLFRLPFLSVTEVTRKAKYQLPID
ncbi:MAG: hypothetical protein RR131_03275 [Anaerovorax sp.]